MDDDLVSPWIARGACLMTAALALSACGAAGGTVCPAIGWSNSLTVGLAAGWATVDGGTLLVECSTPCGMPALRTDEPGDVSIRLTGSSTVVQLDMAAPDSVALTVLGPDGTGLATHQADLDWRRVGGTEECGGPHAASVVIPTP
jgi:hypothetical protein